MKPPQTVVAGASPEAGTATPADSLTAVYRMVGEWFLYPEEIDPSVLSEAALADVLEHAEAISPATSEHLREFRAGYDDVTVGDYLALLELNPRAPLYLGSYQFDDPSTCASAGISDRNQYMIEIANIFAHFGLEIDSEMPDFLPAISEFLALTTGAKDEDAALRLRFIERMVWPGVRLFAQALAKEDAPYGHLVEALTECLRYEAGDLPEPEPRGPEANSQLIQLEEVPGG
jgi:nitrate reductase assembly molybdenum cofactor insertion protein NarJ